MPTLLVRFAIRSIVPMFAFRRRSIWRSKTIGGTCGVVEKNHQRHRACKSEQQETTTCCHRKLPKSKFRDAEAVGRIKYGKNVQNRLRLANRWCEYAAAMVSNSGAQRTFYGNANLELSRRSWRRDRVRTSDQSSLDCAACRDVEAISSTLSTLPILARDLFDEFAGRKNRIQNYCE